MNNHTLIYKKDIRRLLFLLIFFAARPARASRGKKNNKNIYCLIYKEYIRRWLFLLFFFPLQHPLPTAAFPHRPDVR